MSGKTVGFISLGCAKNQINTEIMLAAVKNAGYNITGEPEKSDVVVINTCGFIEDAKKEAIETIFEVNELKKEGKIDKIIVCGCLSERYKDEIASEIPEVDGFIGVGSFGRIVEAVEKVFSGERPIIFESLDNIQLEGERVLTTPPHTAYLKLADGCSNRCSYCAIPNIRGPLRSRLKESIIKEAKALAESGVKELIVIAQDTTSYGVDLYGHSELIPLLNELCKIEGIKWIRLMYLYPDKITDELIYTIKSQQKIVKYIEMPIQHAGENILRAMNRPGNDKSLLELVKKLRREIPGVVLRTTVMVGFPGETEDDFTLLCEFLKNAEFDRLGVFKFSQETGTPAYDMEGAVEEDIKDIRAQNIEMIFSRSAQKAQDALIGKTFEVLCEGYDRIAECYFGRSYAEAPDIDGKIFFKSQRLITSGEFVNVKITESIDFELIGEALS